MTRLIDADALLKRIEEERAYLIARKQYGAEHILMRNFKHLVLVAPIVEARPKSKWWFSEGEWQCMNCGSELELEDITPFCPYCGADMRGDDE